VSDPRPSAAPLAIPVRTKPPAGPGYYESLEPQPIEVIEGWGLGFHAGNVVKYTARAGHKPGNSALSDLLKAKWYLDRLIQLAEKEGP
jgi:hypothetical protein